MVEGNDAGFLEAVHASANLEVDIAVVGYVYLVFWVVPNFLGDDGWVHPHVLEVLHGGAEVIFFYIQAQVAGSMFGIGDGAVDVDLGIQHRYSGGAGVAGVVQFVASGCHADSVCFCFWGPDGAHKVGVGDFAAVRDCSFGDEERGVSALDSYFRWAVTANVVG